MGFVIIDGFQFARAVGNTNKLLFPGFVARFVFRTSVCQDLAFGFADEFDVGTGGNIVCGITVFRCFGLAAVGLFNAVLDTLKRHIVFTVWFETLLVAAFGRNTLAVFGTCAHTVVAFAFAFKYPLACAVHGGASVRVVGGGGRFVVLVPTYLDRFALFVAWYGFTCRSIFQAAVKTGAGVWCAVQCVRVCFGTDRIRFLVLMTAFDGDFAFLVTRFVGGHAFRFAVHEDAALNGG